MAEHTSGDEEAGDGFVGMMVSCFRHRVRVRTLAYLAAGALVTALGLPTADANAVALRSHPAPSAATPTVSGPVPGPLPDQSPALGSESSSITPDALATFGYTQQEFFISGVANAYDFTGTPTSDGRWTVAVVPGSQAAYKTRIEVMAPNNKHAFSGTVVVEWDNVTAGFSSLPDFLYDHDQPLRAGDIYIGVTAQFVGVESAKLNNPSRYGSLVQPGDSYSYDIFSQAGMAARADYRQLFGGLRPRFVIADGESQSADRLATYVDGFAGRDNVYDGYLLHSRFVMGAPLQEAPGTALVAVGPNGELAPTPRPDGNVGLDMVPVPAITQSRTDLAQPELLVETQSDVYGPPNGLLGYGPATQPDSAGFRLWEIAGGAHADDCVVNVCGSDTGNAASAMVRFDDMLNPPHSLSTFPPCVAPINTGQGGYVMEAALAQLARWVGTGGVSSGDPANSAPLFAGQYVGEGPATVPQLGPQGNIIGGVRNPAVDVPVATETGVSTNSPVFCQLAGTSTPLAGAQLTQLYPTHQDFVTRWSIDALRLAHQGYLTPGAALNLIVAAARSSVP
jgi:hypothetical protein